MIAPPRVYVIADRERLRPRPLPVAVAEIAGAGVQWVQVRAKGVAGEELAREIEETLRRLEGSGCRLWIDDRADLAALLPVAGVHLGQEDLPPAAARTVVGEERWIGRSTHGTAQIAAAAADPAVDVVAVGPVYATTSKVRPDPVVGLELLREARRLTDRPLVAIGGIDAPRAPEVLAAGADTVAVIGAVCDAADLAAACRRLLAAAGEAA